MIQTVHETGSRQPCGSEPVAGYRGDSLDKVRTSLGEAQFERAYAKGMTLSLDQALDLALGRGHSA